MGDGGNKRAAWRRTVLTVLAVPSVVFASLVAMPATAAADVLDLANFQLRPNAQGTALRDRADALPLVKANVGDIMNDLNRRDDDRPVAVGEPCETNAGAGDTDIVRSMCFNDPDNATDQWRPQGVTTVADMEGDQEWGNGHQPVLVSWYDANHNEDGEVKGVRVSFMNPDTGAYRHVLLVYPQELSNGAIDYNSVRVSQGPDDPDNPDYDVSLHAGGIVWYGNYLFVADTRRGFRVFDMRRIFDLGASENGTTDGENEIGYQERPGGEMYYGYGYRYIMPQIGSWTRTADSGDKCSGTDGSPNFSNASLDRSGANHLVSGEYCNGEQTTNGRVAAWPIAGAFGDNGELVMNPDYRWNADMAHRIPDTPRRIQGVTRFDGRWYLSQSDGFLHITARATSETRTLEVVDDQPLTVIPQDLSHWPSGTADNPSLGALWTVSEPHDQRMVYSVVPDGQ